MTGRARTTGGSRGPKRVESPADNAPASLALRVRRATLRWPLTELDPIERATFAGAVASAHDFDDLDPAWQEMILAAERGARPTFSNPHRAADALDGDRV